MFPGHRKKTGFDKVAELVDANHCTRLYVENLRNCNGLDGVALKVYTNDAMPGGEPG